MDHGFTVGEWQSLPIKITDAPETEFVVTEVGKNTIAIEEPTPEMLKVIRMREEAKLLRQMDEAKFLKYAYSNDRNPTLLPAPAE